MKSKTSLLLNSILVLSIALTVWPVNIRAAASASAPRDFLTAANGQEETPIQGQPAPKWVRTNPDVSEPVAPADTEGLPPAPAVDLFEGQPREMPSGFPLPGREQTADAPEAYDLAAPQALSVDSMPPPIVNFEGLDNSTGVLPPDTNGQVGPNHYVQIVNATVVGIYDKSAGTLLYSTFLLGDLWPVGQPCHGNSGDPIVLYDQLADRWLLTQFTSPYSPPYHECIAISRGPTPTNDPNDWYLYDFTVHSTKFNDYPKLGVWPDGYYMSANQFNYPGFSWGGAGVWVFERDEMLDGDPATFQYFDVANIDIDYGGLLPSGLLGSTLPPTGAPNYFMSVDQDWSGTDDVLHIFEFHTDWATPANSTFSLVADLVVDPFDWDICPNYRERCIHQPDGAPQLEAISDRLMMYLWYRNFGSHESLVVNHTVDADGAGRAGIRWYEIRGGSVNTTLADATIYQQGTFAPADGNHRWMGSIAMDRVGNVALGYSLSSTSVYPSIRYAGRQVNDPLGTLPRTEQEIIAGSGVQTHSAARWGDYSAMAVDPVNDCTFWYTQEYIETTGSAPWQTRIASFKFPNCPPPDQVSYVFTVSSSGQYHFTGRAKAPTAADDSFCVNLIDIATGERIWDTTEPSQCGDDIYWDFWVNANWQEVVLSDGWNGSQTQVVVNLTAGRTYQITIRRREDGTLLDWLKLHQGTPSTKISAVSYLIEAEDFSRISGDMALIHDSSAGGDNTVIGIPNGASTTAAP